MSNHKTNRVSSLGKTDKNKHQERVSLFTYLKPYLTPPPNPLPVVVVGV